MRRFVVGDLHGNYKGLKQALEKVNFDYDRDILISLGDIADGYSEVPEIIEEFMKMKNLIWCLGNHDEWVQKWMKGVYSMKHVPADGDFSHPNIDADAHNWLSQGGKATFKAYMNNPELITKHREFWLTKPVLYYTHIRNGETICFVHAGWNRDRYIAAEAKRVPYYLYWDRNFWGDAIRAGKDTHLISADGFGKTYIGHTSTNFFGELNPMYRGGVWNLDTGAGWHGVVTIMDVDTEEYVQSNLATELYPDEIPRK